MGYDGDMVVPFRRRGNAPGPTDEPGWLRVHIPNAPLPGTPEGFVRTRIREARLTPALDLAMEHHLTGFASQGVSLGCPRCGYFDAAFTEHKLDVLLSRLISWGDVAEPRPASGLLRSPYRGAVADLCASLAALRHAD